MALRGLSKTWGPFGTLGFREPMAVNAGQLRTPRPPGGCYLHVLTRLILGGPTRPVLSLIAAACRQGHRAVLAVGEPSAFEREAQLPGCGEQPIVHRVPGMVREPSLIKDLKALQSIRQLIRHHRPTVVFTHTAKAGALGRLAVRWSGQSPAVIHTFHGHSLARSVSGNLAFVWTWIERRLAALPNNRIVALSPALADDLVRRLGASARLRLAVVPLAFDPASYPSEAGEEGQQFAQFRAQGNGPVLLFVGRGVSVKGLKFLAEALCRSAALEIEGQRRVRIVIVGPVDPGVRTEVESILSSGGCRSRWEFFGPVDQPFPLMRLADGLVLPSRSEGTPVSVIEALWLGRPVLASAVGGVPELLQAEWKRVAPGCWRTEPGPPRGRLLPSEDRDAWSRALIDWGRGEPGIPGTAEERRHFVETTFNPDDRFRELMTLVGGQERPESAGRSAP